MKKTLFLLVVAFILFVPGLVNAESSIKMSVACDNATLNVGEETVCRVIGSSDAEGKTSLNQSGVTNVTLKVVTSGNYALSYVDKYSTSNGWYLSGSFNNNVYSFTLNLANANNTSTEMFTFKVKANSRAETLKSTVTLQDVSITANGSTSQLTVENGYEITVNADPNNKGNDEHNPSTGDNTLLMIGIAGFLALSIGYVSYRKLNAR